jgi:hypothetical protein
MKHVEWWVRTQIRVFGCVAKQFAAFARVCASLETDGGRQKVLVCLRERIPLAGWPPPSQQQRSAGSSTQASRYMVSGTVTARCVRVFPRGALSCMPRTMQPGKHASVAGEAGIDECRTILAEMSKLKAGTTLGKSNEIEDGPQTPEFKTNEIEYIDGTTPGMDEIVEMDIENHTLDPVLLKARDLAGSEMVHVSIHTELCFCMYVPLVTGC